MKDLLGREVQVGNYICYALTAGRSANLAVYQVKEVLDNKIKAVKIDESYSNCSGNFTLTDGTEIPCKYIKWSSKMGEYIEMTEDEKFKVDSKTSTLSMSERIFILDGFDKSLFEANS